MLSPSSRRVQQPTGAGGLADRSPRVGRRRKLSVAPRVGVSGGVRRAQSAGRGLGGAGGRQVAGAGKGAPRRRLRASTPSSDPTPSLSLRGG